MSALEETIQQSELPPMLFLDPFTLHDSLLQLNAQARYSRQFLENAGLLSEELVTSDTMITDDNGNYLGIQVIDFYVENHAAAPDGSRVANSVGVEVLADFLGRSEIDVRRAAQQLQTEYDLQTASNEFMGIPQVMLSGAINRSVIHGIYTHLPEPNTEEDLQLVGHEDVTPIGTISNQDGNSPRDELDLSTIYREHHGRLHSLILGMFKDPMVAEEAVSMTFLKVVKHIGSYDRSRKIKPWLNRIAVNCAKDYVRSHAYTEKLFSTVDVDDYNLGDVRARLIDASVDQETLLDKTTRVRQIYEARKRITQLAELYLNPEQKEALLLRHLDGYSYDEIMCVQDVPMGTLKSRLSRARKRLNPYLEEPLVDIHE